MRSEDDPLDGLVSAADDSPVSTWARVWPFLVAGIGGVGLAVAIVYTLGDTVTGQLGVGGSATGIVLAVLPLYAVAVFLIRMRPAHPEARWLLLVASSIGAGTGIEAATKSAARTSGPGEWLWVVSLAWQWTTVLCMVAVVALLAYFPDGVPDRRWQAVAVRSTWGLLALPPLLLLTRPELVIDRYLLDTAPLWDSPFAVSWLAPLGVPLQAVYHRYAAFALVGVAILLWRYRVADAAQRRPMRLLVWTMLVGAVAIGADFALRAAGVPADALVLRVLGQLSYAVLVMVAISVVVGVLRYRLFDTDVVIRRSVVYGALTVGIAVVYTALAAAPGLTLGRQIPVELAVVLTILAAVAFQPLRRRLEALADRWVFGARVNRYQLLTRFGASLEQTVELRELLPTLADTVRRGLGASWVRVSLPGANAGAGQPSGEPALTVPLERGGEVVGRIECGPKRGGYEPGDRELLATLAGQAATAIANVALTAQLAERLEELEQSRARIVAAQDGERRRIERNIHDGAQQQLVALLMKLRLARNQLGRGERSCDEVLDEVHADVRDLLTDLRELARGIHPPVLTDRGLVAAVETRADRLPLDVAVRADPALRERRLGADVEGAAYFVVCEALTNVVKHANASHAQVDLSAVNRHLEIAVSDNGAGFGDTNGNGSGLVNLRDRVEALGGRLTVENGRHGGTTVHAELPVAVAGAAPC